MSPIAIYIAFSVMLLAYFFQAREAVTEAGRTSLPNQHILITYLAGKNSANVRHWPFFAITIFFPFAISAVPKILDIPELTVPIPDSTDIVISVGAVFVEISNFAINYLVVLITVEFSLLYGFERLKKEWQKLLVVATALDIVMYFLVSSASKSIAESITEYAAISWFTVLFLILGCAISFFASLFVVVSIRLINDFEIIPVQAPPSEPEPEPKSAESIDEETRNAGDPK